jgi:N-acetylmuramoyl-L-alanine amidase
MNEIWQGEDAPDGDGNTEGNELAEISLPEEIEAAESAKEVFSDGPADPATATDLIRNVWDRNDYFTRFSALIGELNLRHLTAGEFLFLGGSNAPGERCAGRNSLPPEGLWPNLRKTARMLDEIRHRLGSPIVILSAFRSASYNQCVGGESASRHMRFDAIDFVSRSGTASDWWRIAREVRGSDPDFEGGIGRYASFVHIDTRGRRADW